jgi:hypothetical protein
MVYLIWEVHLKIYGMIKMPKCKRFQIYFYVLVRITNWYTLTCFHPSIIISIFFKVLYALSCCDCVFVVDCGDSMNERRVCSSHWGQVCSICWLWWVNDLWIVKEHFEFHYIENLILYVDYGSLWIVRKGSHQGEMLVLFVDYGDSWFMREGFILVRSLFCHCCCHFV